LQFALALLGKAFLQNRSFQADAIGPKAGVRKVRSQTTLLERNMFDMNVAIPPTSPVPIILMIFLHLLVFLFGLILLGADEIVRSVVKHSIS
jgi:hypothetical protein